MDYIKIKCRKCGYEIEIPENTVKVHCGSCGSVNQFGKISSILKRYSDSAFSGRYDGVPEEIKNTPDYAAQNLNNPETVIAGDEDDIDFPENKKASKIITVVLILAPFIVMVLDFFKLPLYTAIPFILLIVLIILSRGKQQ